MIQRILNILIALDQLGWTLITLGKGSPDETISAALYRMESQNKLAGKLFRPVVDFLFLLFEKDHCKNAATSEKTKSQLPEYYK